MEIIYFGHSCFGIEINGKNVLFDPFISPNELARHIEISKIKADYILISHGHEDHIADAVGIALRTGATVVSNWELYNWFLKQGVEKAHPMNTGGSRQFDSIKVKCTHAAHSSSLPDGSYGGNPMGFIVEAKAEKLYYAGDTALTMDMKIIGEFEKPAIAFLPVGDNFTMGINDALIASGYINCNKIIAMHFDTFGYIKIDHEEAKRKFSKAGKELIIMKPGDSISA